MGDLIALIERLDLAVQGTPYGTVLDADTLLHRVGEMRRQLEAAHHWLDLKGIPRKEADGGVLTVRGRLEKLDERGGET